MKAIELTQGKCAIVDDEDYEYLNQWNWHYSATYARRNLPRDGGKRQKVQMHREIIIIPKGLEPDHINGDRLDNRKINLRVVTRRQNLQNIHKTWGNSKFKGVYCRENRWYASIMTDSGRIVKRCRDEKQAAETYNDLATKHFGKYAHLNRIKE